MNRKEKVLKFFEKDARFAMTLSECEAVLGVPESDRAEFYSIIDELLQEKKLVKKGKRISLAKNEGLFEGEFISGSRGYGFVFSKDYETDFYVSAENKNGAIDRDFVQVEFCKSAYHGAKKEVKVLKVLRRSERKITGLFSKLGGKPFLFSNDKKLPDEIFVCDNEAGAKDGDRVVALINPENLKKCECRITQILGKDGDIGLDVREILIKNEIKDEFPENVMRAAKRQPSEVVFDENVKRCDLTDELIVTIDGADAKDLDDAVSIKRLENGNFELGVHIADVAEYVKRGSVIDKEAFIRGTSVYPVDRVVPMLPVELSNGICSLNPGVLRNALSVVMEINKDGAVLNRRIFESVIKSSAKMTYKEVNEILAGKKEVCEKYSSLVCLFKDMQTLSEILHNRRKARGSVDFNFPECKAVLDENGKCIDIIKYERGISNGIIEEFMLVCNETVASFMREMNLPAVYRIHEPPTEEKIAVLSDFVKKFGYFLPKNTTKVTPASFSKILKESKGRPEERAISHLMLRSMMKACYSDENLGHFALALKNYCHFTSPIRRYPDLCVHRIIKDFLHKKKMNKDLQKAFVKEAAERSSAMEVKAQEAEREALELKKIEYISEFIGEKFEGIISSVTSFGIFVELDNTVEGLVSMNELYDDFYELDEENLCLFGRRKGKIFAVGDKIKITVLGCNKKSGEINFSLAGEKGKKKDIKSEKLISKKKGDRKKQKNKVDTKRFLKKKSKRRKRR